MLELLLTLVKYGCTHRLPHSQLWFQLLRIFVFSCARQYNLSRACISCCPMANIIQAGFQPESHIGNELDPAVRAKYAASSAASLNTYSHRIYENSLQGVESISESQTVFPRHKPVLMGMTLDKVPTGGFSSPVSIMLGGADESTFRINDNSYFMQPGNAAKRTEVSNGVPITGGFPKSELIYKTASGKTRNPHNAMTIHRAEQEAERGTRRMEAARQTQMLGGLPVPQTAEPRLSQPNATTPAVVSQQYAPVPVPPAQTQPHVVYLPRPGPSPAAVAPVTVVVKQNTLPQFWDATKNVLSGKCNREQMQEYGVEYWSYIVNIVLLVLVIILMIVAIAVCAMPPKVKKVYYYHPQTSHSFESSSMTRLGSSRN